MSVLEGILDWLSSSLLGDFSPLELAAFLGAPLAIIANRYLYSQIRRDIASYRDEFRGGGALERLQERLGVGAALDRLASLRFVLHVLLFFIILSGIQGFNPQSPDLAARARGAVFSLVFISIEVHAVWLMWRNLRTRQGLKHLIQSIAAWPREEAATRSVVPPSMRSLSDRGRADNEVPAYLDLPSQIGRDKQTGDEG